MKKFFVVLCVFTLILLSGCSSTAASDSKDDVSATDGVTVYIPEDDDGSHTSETLFAENENSEFNGLYYANTKTKKFHKNNCKYAKTVKNENLYITDNKEELLSSGYSSCKICTP